MPLVLPDALPLTPQTFAVFIDETGNEDYSDPNNPTFGRGGCAVVGSNYDDLLKHPWRKLKREKLGGAIKPFHATAFEQSRPSLRQITSINNFLRRPFWRFAVMSDSRTALPTGIDGHKAVSLVTSRFITKIVATLDVDVVALVFEQSERGDTLVQRDFDLSGMEVFNKFHRRIVVDGYFMPKSSLEPGLEIADLVAHTAGRQRRREISGREGTNLDFQHMYWHSPIPPAFMSIGTVELNELTIADHSAPGD